MKVRRRPQSHAQGDFPRPTALATTDAKATAGIAWAIRRATPASTASLTWVWPRVASRRVTKPAGLLTRDMTSSSRPRGARAGLVGQGPNVVPLLTDALEGRLTVRAFGLVRRVGRGGALGDLGDQRRKLGAAWQPLRRVG